MVNPEPGGENQPRDPRKANSHSTTNGGELLTAKSRLTSENTATDKYRQFVPVSLSRVSKASAIYDIVKEGIVSGLWLPGDRINDKDLSEKLGVSRISVREALAKLVESQLVDRVQWKGFFLRKLTLKEAKSIIEIRIALEQLAIKSVMRKNDGNLYQKLEKSIADAEAAIHSGNHSEYMTADFRFHDMIHEASGNVWIKTIIGNLRMTINILRNVSMMVDFEEAALASTADHRRILAHMKSGKSKEALKSLRDHMKTHYRNIVQEYRNLFGRSQNSQE